MAQKLATKIGRKYLGDQAKTFEPEDPRYENYTDRKGRTKRRERALPEGLTKQQQKALTKIRRRAHRLDKGFSVCGIRFGWSAVIGLIPAIGDVADAILSYLFIIRIAERDLHVPPIISAQMKLNILVGSGIGTIPLAGDIFLAVWKQNSRNAHLVEEWLVAELKKKQGNGANIGKPTNAASGEPSTSTSTSTTRPADGSDLNSTSTSNKPPVRTKEDHELADQVVKSHKNSNFSRKTGHWMGWKNSGKANGQTGPHSHQDLEAQTAERAVAEAGSGGGDGEGRQVQAGSSGSGGGGGGAAGGKTTTAAVAVKK